MTTDEMTVFAEMGRVDPPTVAVTDSCVGLVFGLARDERARGDRARTRRRVLRPLVAITGVAAAVAVALVATAVLPNGGGSHGALLGIGAQPAAAAVLHEAASAAATQSGVPAGKFAYVDSTETILSRTATPTGGVYWARENAIRQTWTASDGAGRTKLTYTFDSFASQADQQVWAAASRPKPVSQDLDWTYGPGDQRAAGIMDPAGLPTDLTALRQTIEKRYEGSTPDTYATFDFAAELLASPAAQPAQRAALFTLMSELPGVVLVGPTNDGLGRAGTAIGMVNSGVRLDVIIDRTTATVLGTRQVVVSPKADVAGLGGVRAPVAGTAISTLTYTATAIVDSTTSTK